MKNIEQMKVFALSNNDKTLMEELNKKQLNLINNIK